MHARDIHPSLPTWLSTLEQRFVALVADEGPMLRRVSAAGIGTRGKRVRPTLLLLACHAFGPVTTRTLDFATLVELVHAASLAHDDVLDEADLRRGEASLPDRFGNKLSILVGDYLLARVFEMATAEGDSRLLSILAGAATAMTRAVILEITDLSLDADEELYWYIVRGKTASLFAAAARVGAALGGAGTAEQAAMARCGEAFGCAFQVADDVLDVQGTLDPAGKPHGADWRQRRVTLPVLHVLANAPPAVAAKVRELWMEEGNGEERLAALRATLDAYGSFSYGWEQVTACRSRALAELAAVPPGPGREALERFCCDHFPLPVLPTAS